MQGRQFGVLDVVGLSLDVVEFTGEKDGSILGTIEASALGSHDSLGDLGAPQGHGLVAIIVHVLFGSHNSRSSFSYA